MFESRLRLEEGEHEVCPYKLCLSHSDLQLEMSHEGGHINLSDQSCGSNLGESHTLDVHRVSVRECVPFTTADGSTIREVFNPRNSALLNGSLAHASLDVGQKTTRHFHPQAEEIYFVLKGRGLMEVDGERVEIGAGDAVAIPNGAKHQIEAVGEERLEFLCCCAPAYTHEDTVLCEEETLGDN